MKLSYKQKLFIYFFIVFAVFTVVITFFQQNREKAYKTETLRTTLDDYSDIIARYVQQYHLINTGQMDSLKNVLVLMPSNLRLTIVKSFMTIVSTRNKGSKTIYCARKSRRH